MFTKVSVNPHALTRCRGLGVRGSLVRIQSSRPFRLIMQSLTVTAFDETPAETAPDFQSEGRLRIITCIAGSLRLSAEGRDNTGITGCLNSPASFAHRRTKSSAHPHQAPTFARPISSVRATSVPPGVSANSFAIGSPRLRHASMGNFVTGRTEVRLQSGRRTAHSRSPKRGVDGLFHDSSD